MKDLKETVGFDEDGTPKLSMFLGVIVFFVFLAYVLKTYEIQFSMRDVFRYVVDQLGFIGYPVLAILSMLLAPLGLFLSLAPSIVIYLYLEKLFKAIIKNSGVPSILALVATFLFFFAILPWLYNSL